MFSNLIFELNFMKKDRIDKAINRLNDLLKLFIISKDQKIKKLQDLLFGTEIFREFKIGFPLSVILRRKLSVKKSVILYFLTI